MNEFRSGFVALIGLPNVGKSTLINRIVGTKIAIVSKKPQTTRNRIAGIYNDDDCQIVFLDTPGIHKAKNKLDRFMSSVTDSSAADVDLVVFLIDARKGLRDDEREVIERIKGREGDIPVIIAVNKTDAADSDELDGLRAVLDHYGRVVYISALTGDGVPGFIDLVKGYMPEGPKYFLDDELTDQSVRMLYSEIIREKALKHLGKEIPHGIGVSIEKLQADNETGVLHIDAVIYCEKQSHKGIIIGRQGSRLKKIGTEAREDIESVHRGKVFMNLWVKVKEDWRNDGSFIKSLGYSDD